MARPDPLIEALAAYRQRWPDEAANVVLFEQLLAGAPSPGSAPSDPALPFKRERLEGHFTASAWVVAADGKRTLLTHHRKLGLWLQPGGHADGDTELARAALKEAEEETGLPGLRIESEIFDLDRHWIPEHKGVPAHWHYDVRYVVRAGADEAFVVSEESHALAWRDIAELANEEAADPSVRRMAQKWLARL